VLKTREAKKSELSPWGAHTESQWCSTRKRVPRKHWAMSGDIFSCHDQGLWGNEGKRAVLPESSSWRPGIPLNTLQCTRHPPRKRSTIWSDTWRCQDWETLLMEDTES
jgi:hypothetical protein